MVINLMKISTTFSLFVCFSIESREHPNRGYGGMRVWNVIYLNKSFLNCNFMQKKGQTPIPSKPIDLILL